MPGRPSDSARPLLAGVEGGGSKFVCAVASEPGTILERTRVETTTPDGTLRRVADFLAPHGPVSVGVAMFGPLELRPGPDFGSTLETPKPGWNHVPVRARLGEALNAPVGIDTDVNAAAVAEQQLGAARGADPVLYVTVGTGIGAGLVVRGRPVHGLMHPELGHLPMPTLSLSDGTPDDFAGTCPFHGRCLEGLASGTALAARAGGDPAGLPEDHPVWELQARQLAHGLAAAVLVASPERIVLGGGVMGHPGLLQRVRRELSSTLAGYVPRSELGAGIDRYVVPPAFDDAGLVGALFLASEQGGARSVAFP